MSKKTATPKTDEPAEAIADWLEHDEALAEFQANPGLSWVRTRLGDGRVGDLSRTGEFRAVASGE